MIQRKQSLWLLLAALISACVFLLNVLSITYVSPADLKIIHQGVSLLEYSYYLPVVVALMVIMPLFTIFLYKNRKKQVMFAVLSILLNIAFVALFLISVDSFKNAHQPPIQEMSYGAGAFLPVASVILLVMAITGINKDEKMVRASYDRLR